LWGQISTVREWITDKGVGSLLSWRWKGQERVPKRRLSLPWFLQNLEWCLVIESFMNEARLQMNEVISVK
jgi:hypothetical protein